MEIELKRIPIKEVISGYEDYGESGVTAYGGLLAVRPKYQREFVYKDKQRNAVIDSITKNLPLNVMYWMKNDFGRFEVLDGQQRTISIGQFISGDFSIDGRFFHNLNPAEQDQILDYELMIYQCEGTDKERLDWFRIINIAGEKLSDQELRNAVYTGPWLSDAKTKFSKTNCVAYLLSSEGGALLRGSPIRQDYLETALEWLNDSTIEEYMGDHQHDENANELWCYFKDVIEWVRKVFPNYRKEMRGIKWGILYNEFKNDFGNGQFPSSDQLEERVTKLMLDEDVTKKAGIYVYLLTGDEKYLSIRSFSDSTKREVYERQNAICVHCREYTDIADAEADHITPWCEGGKTIVENCQMLCKHCNRTKGGK